MSKYSIISLIFLIFAFNNAQAFSRSPKGLLGKIVLVNAPLQSRQSNLFAAPKKSSGKALETSDSSEFWQGEWVCADCGYVYDKDIDGGGKYFEEQGRGFICPQCSAPRKRYAKKVGDQWGVTRDGGDLPIYAWTFAGLAAVVWFTFYYVPTL